MRIKISKQAAQIYVSSLGRHMPINYEWKRMLERVQGKTLTVETDYLFVDQYNTAPINGITDRGLRIMANCVTHIFGDIRLGQQRCQWCGNHSEQDGTDYCPRCSHLGYLEKWDEVMLKRYNPCATFIPGLHGFIYNDLFCLRIRLSDGRTASVPLPEPGADDEVALTKQAWADARKWATDNDCTTIETRDDYAVKREEPNQQE